MGELPIERGFPASVWRGDVVMRNKKRFFSGFLAALMLLSVGLPVLAEELPEAESKPVCTCSARCNADAPDEDCPVCREDPADCMGTPLSLIHI